MMVAARHPMLGKIALLSAIRLLIEKHTTTFTRWESEVQVLSSPPSNFNYLHCIKARQGSALSRPVAHCCPRKPKFLLESAPP